MPLHIRVFAFLFLLLSAAACKKEREKQPPIRFREPTIEEKLSGGSWMLRSYKLVYLQNGATIEKEYIDSLDSCNTDGVYIFRKDGSMEASNFPKKCTATEPDWSVGEWELINNKLLKTTISGISHMDTILTVSEMDFTVMRPGDTCIKLWYTNALRTTGK